MSKALAEIGWSKALRFGLTTLAMLPYRALPVPQLRAPFLRMLGARIGPRAILHDVRFFNLYRTGLAGLSIGAECFLAEECLLDLAERIELGRQVTVGQRTVILTHLNVGYADPQAGARDVRGQLPRPGYLGLQPATPTAVLAARFFAALYFAFFLLMPFYTRAEKTRAVPERVVYHGK